MNYDEAIYYIVNTQKFGSKLGLERISILMDYLGNPHRELKIIHVAGTNGKGSTSSYISTVLGRAGYRVGLFTSPSLESFNERIMLNNIPIENDDLVKATQRVKNQIDNMVKDGIEHPTEFEIVTAIAMVYFVEKKADFVVLEVGLGGRYDSTNVIEKSIASIITPIAMDHMDVLGDTIEKITWEKAGIIKDNGLVISYPQVEEAQKVICDVAKERRAEVIKVPINNVNIKDCGISGSLFDYKYNEVLIEDLRISLLGEHQIYNAAVAITTILALRSKGIISISNEEIKLGLIHTEWKGRLEILKREPTTIIDGAHNLHGVRALKRTMKKIFPDKRIIMVISILSDKEIHEMLEELIPLAHSIIVTESDNPRVLKAEKLAEIISQYRQCSIEYKIEDAVSKAESLATKEDIVLYCGSLYMIKDARKVIVNI